MQKKVFNHNRIELLAPAGGMEQLTSAVENGADAVYLGGKSYNARAKAGNFDIEEIETACRYCHIRGVKVYVTLNTLIGENENMDKIVSYAGALSCCGVDALIIQDFGLGTEIRKKHPEIELHLSTQGTVYNHSGAMLAKSMGYSRVIMARECSLSQICGITGGNNIFADGSEMTGGDSVSSLAIKSEGAPPEVEVFVHGALCFCYSGQCQLSRFIGGRSGNKGVCAQPCRLEYSLDGRKGFHLSPKDICTLDYLPELAEAGVRSLKIEGRLKSAEYVGTVVGIYRKYLDLWYEIIDSVKIEDKDKRRRILVAQMKHKYSVGNDDREKLMQVFNRVGFTDGYLISDPKEDLLTGNIPKNQGVKIGNVLSCDRKQLVKIRLDSNYSQYPLSIGDRIEIHSGPGELPGNIVTYLKNSGKNTVILGDIKNIRNGIPEGSPVYRISSKKQLEDMRKTYEEGGPYGTKHRAAVPVSFGFFGFKGSHPILKISLAGAHPLLTEFPEIAVSVEDEYVIPEAINRPTDELAIKKQLIKLGGTPFICDEKNIDVKIDDNIMVPASVLNSMRREAAVKLEDAIISKWNKDRNADNGDVRKACSGSRADRGMASGAVWFHTWKGFSESGKLLKSMSAHSEKILICVPVKEWFENAGNSPVELPESKSEKYILVPYLSAVTMGSEDSFIEKHFDRIVEISKEKSQGLIIINNLGWLREFADAGLDLLAGHGLNVNNRYTAKLLLETGICDVFASLENSDYNSGMIPLMITEHTIPGKLLTDRKGKRYAVISGVENDLVCGENDRDEKEKSRTRKENDRKRKTLILAMKKERKIPDVENGWAIPCVFVK